MGIKRITQTKTDANGDVTSTRVLQLSFEFTTLMLVGLKRFYHGIDSDITFFVPDCSFMSQH